MTDEVEDAVVEQAIEEPTEEIEAEATETEESEQEPSESSTEKNKVQERIDELTRIRREAERDRDYWRELATKKEPEPDPVKPVEIEVKTLEDFEYDEKAYQAYVFETARQQAVEAAKHALQEDKTINDTQERQKAFEARENKYSETVPDYKDVTRDPSLSLTKEMVDIAAASDDGPALLYYLGKNPDIAASIARLSPIDAAREIGRIEATKLTKDTKVTSKAPSPPPKIDGVNAGTKVNPDEPASDKLSMDAWLKAREKQIAKR